MKSVIIDRLIQIEESAQSITNGIDEKESSLPVLINEKCEALEKSLKEEYEKKAREVELAKQKEGERKLQDIEADYKRRVKKLEEFFEQNHAEWENELFNRIIGR